MAPEVISGKEHTKALDFWALGVISFEFMTGRKPFVDDTVDLVFKHILNKNLTYPEIGDEEG